MTHGYGEEKRAIVARLRRIEGRLRDLERMIDGVALKILEGYAEHCVADALASSDEVEAETKRRELLEAINRFTRAR